MSIHTLYFWFGIHDNHRVNMMGNSAPQKLKRRSTKSAVRWWKDGNVQDIDQTKEELPSPDKLDEYIQEQRRTTEAMQQVIERLTLRDLSKENTVTKATGPCQPSPTTASITNMNMAIAEKQRKTMEIMENMVHHLLRMKDQTADSMTSTDSEEIQRTERRRKRRHSERRRKSHRHRSHDRRRSSRKDRRSGSHSRRSSRKRSPKNLESATRSHSNSGSDREMKTKKSSSVSDVVADIDKEMKSLVNLYLYCDLSGVVPIECALWCLAPQALTCTEGRAQRGLQCIVHLSSIDVFFL